MPKKGFFTIKKHIARILDAYCTVKTERDRKKVNFCQKMQTLKKITPSSGENNSSMFYGILFDILELETISEGFAFFGCFDFSLL